MRNYILIIISSVIAIVLIAYLLISKFGGTLSRLINPQAICPKCNVLIIDIDILRADHLPCYDYKVNTAPYICAFAQNSALLKDNYSNSDWTLPSIFSTITSLYPSFHNIQFDYIDRLDTGIPTIADSLQQEGYKTIFATHASNNYAIPGQNNRGLRGYQEVINNSSVPEIIKDLSGSSQPWFVHYYNSNLHMPYILPKDVKPIVDMPSPKNFPTYQSDFNEDLNEYLKKHIYDVFQQKAINEYPIMQAASTSGDVDLTNIFYTLMEKNWNDDYLVNPWMAFYNTYIQYIDPNDTNSVRYLQTLYDTKISLADNDVNAILNSVKQAHFENNTIIILTSDHGEAFGEQGFFSHLDSYHSELYHTPLIIHVPGLGHKDVDETSSNVDIFPTVIDLLGLKIPQTLQGDSFVPYLYGKVTHEYRFALGETAGGSGVVIQNKDWLYYLPTGTPAFNKSVLYSKSNDPLEKNNVVDEHPVLARKLYEQANSYIARVQKYVKDHNLPTAKVFQTQWNEEFDTSQKSNN